MKYCIGIDPGTKTGVGVWDIQEKRLVEVTSRTARDAEDLVLKYYSNGGCFVVVEDARQMKTGRRADSVARLRGVGSVRRDSIRWEEFLTSKKINFIMVKPQARWKGAANAKMFAGLTKWQKPTDSHGRDAAWLCFERSAEWAQAMIKQKAV